MDSVQAFLNTVLAFLLRLLELVVGFFIAMLNLLLEFARSVAGLAS